MVKLLMAGVAVASVAAGSASAQQVYYWPAANTPAAASRSYFPMGTPVAFRTRTEVNTKQSRPGDRFYLEVAEAVSYRGQVVIPAGSPAIAEVTRSEANGHFGKRGTIEVRLLYVETPYGPVRLSGQAANHGTDHALLSIGGAVAVLGWGPLLIHGTSGYIRHDTPVTGYLAEPLAFQTQPLAVQSAAYVQPDDARALPASFTPGAFGANGPGLASR